MSEEPNQTNITKPPFPPSQSKEKLSLPTGLGGAHAQHPHHVTCITTMIYLIPPSRISVHPCAAATKISFLPSGWPFSTRDFDLVSRVTPPTSGHSTMPYHTTRWYGERDGFWKRDGRASLGWRRVIVCLLDRVIRYGTIINWLLCGGRRDQFMLACLLGYQKACLNRE
jgi:hypothetical protein